MAFINRVLKAVFGGKHKKRSGIYKYLIITPICILLAFIFTYFVVSDNYLRNYILLNQAKKEVEKIDAAGDTSIGYTWDAAPSPVGEDVVPLIGAKGIRAMYIHKMTSGYYKEYLEIVRDHVTWKSMSENVKPLLKGGKEVYPSVPLILGLMLCEGGAENEDSVRASTNSVISRLAYKEDGKHTLSKFNSAVAAADGGKTLSAGYNGNLDLIYNGALDKRTHLQYSAGYAAIYPSGRYTAEALYWPSKMNGYGIESTAVRTKADTDAAYFPDDISIVLQRAWSSINYNSKLFSIEALTPTAVETIMYPIYNYGESGMSYYWGIGTPVGGSDVFSLANWNEKNTITFAENTSNSINYIDSLIVDILDTLTLSYDTYTKGIWDSNNYPYFNHQDYQGLSVASILLNGGFITRSQVPTLKNYMNDEGFMRGALLAFRIFRSKPNATMADVRQWLNSINPKEIPSTYGNYQNALVHYTDKNSMIYPDNEDYQLPALRSYSYSVRGPFMARIGGVMVYWKMLEQAGVKCSFGEAYLDSQGNLIQQSPFSNYGSYSYLNGTRPFYSYIPGSSEITKCTSTSTYRDLDISRGIHYGEDFVANYIDLASIADGVVYEVSDGGTGGLKIGVDIISPDGEPRMQYTYMHLNKAYVKVGDRVKAGQIVAQSGASGGNYAAHLHLELRIMRGAYNTVYFLQFKSIFDGNVTAEYAPGLIAGGKLSPGNVYDKNGKFLGSIEKLPHTASPEPYLMLGQNYWLPQALAAEK